MNRARRGVVGATVVMLAVTACGGQGGGPATASASRPASPGPSAFTGTAPSASAAAEDAAWIVFQGMDGLARVRPDGSDLHAAAPGIPEVRHPDWSPDGALLAFTSDDADETRDIWVARWDGTEARELVDCARPCWDADSPAFSPDGRSIAYHTLDLVDGESDGSRLMLLDLAGGEPREIVATAGARYLVAPRWSPDGRFLAVAVEDWSSTGEDAVMTGSAVGIVDLDATRPAVRLLTDPAAFGAYPDWHPTGDLIVFEAGSPDPLDPARGAVNLFSIRPDGTDLRQLTFAADPEPSFLMPSFRRDGPGILVTLRDSGGRLSLASVAEGGGEATPIGVRGGIPGAHSRQRPPG